MVVRVRLGELEAASQGRQVPVALGRLALG